MNDLLSMALPTTASPRFPHSQRLPSGSSRKPLILTRRRAQRLAGDELWLYSGGSLSFPSVFKNTLVYFIYFCLHWARLAARVLPLASGGVPL